jgi:hypothetical protein
VGPRAGLDRCGKSRPPTGIQSPDRPARSSVAIPTELSGPQIIIVIIIIIIVIILRITDNKMLSLEWDSFL